MVQRLIPVSMLLILGCSAPPPPAAPHFAAVVDFKQLMEWIIDPAADVIWDSVKSVITESGTKEIAPQTDEQWAAVRNGAATLAESANLLMMEGRARDNKEWMTAALRLSTSADHALKAAQAKKVDALFTAGEEIYHACDGCHQRYAAFAQPNAAPAKSAN